MTTDSALESSRPSGRLKLGWTVALVILLLDQASKYYVLSVLDTYQRVNVLPVLDWVLLHNYGAAFSFLADFDGGQRWFLLAVAVVAVVMIHRWLGKASLWVAIFLGLILGGAIGNALDRAILGSVTDFILVYYRDWYYPAFNIADIGITLGAMGILYDGFQEWRRERANNRT